MATKRKKAHEPKLNTPSTSRVKIGQNLTPIGSAQRGEVFLECAPFEAERAGGEASGADIAHGFEGVEMAGFRVRELLEAKHGRALLSGELSHRLCHGAHHVVSIP